MSKRADKGALFTPRLPERDVDVPGVGSVRVRGMSRIEVMLCQKIDDIAARERRMLAIGLVDPQLTDAEAGRWQDASPAGELEPVTNAIYELSGMGKGSSKSGVRGVRGRSGAGVRALPGGETEHDGGSAAGDAEQ